MYDYLELLFSSELLDYSRCTCCASTIAEEAQAMQDRLDHFLGG
jgi:hypothetical protein